MKVLIVSWNLYPENTGGSGKSVYYTAKGLSKLPEISKIHILTSTKGETRSETDGKLKIERYNDLDIKFRTGIKSFSFEDIRRKLGHLEIYKNWSRRIREKYWKFNPDVIHCSDPFSLRQVRKALGYKLKTPVIISVKGSWSCSSTGDQLDGKKRIIDKWKFRHSLNSHGIMAPYKHYIFVKNKNNLKSADGIQFGSQYIKDRTEENVSLNTLRRVIHNPCPRPKTTGNKKSDPNTIAYVGELTYKKGLHKLLDALKILVDEGKNYKLLVAGVGPMEDRFKRFVNKNNLDKNVVFLGWVNEPNEVYQKSTVTVVPSLWPDTFPRVAFEPMFNNRIPIVSRYGGMPEAVPLKELIVNVENPVELADRIRDIMENPAKQKEIKKTFKSWLNQFTLKANAEKYLSLYRDAIKYQDQKKK